MADTKKNFLDYNGLSIFWKKVKDVIEVNKTITDDTISSLEGRVEDLEKGNNIPFENGRAENTAVLKGEYEGYSNNAISKTSIALGGASNAGLKGWYYSGIDFANNKIYLSKTQPNSIKTSDFTTDTSITLDDIQGPEEGLIIKKRTQYIVGDALSIVCNSKYENKCKITAVEPGIITVDAIPFTSNDLPSYTLGIGKMPDDFTLYSVMPEVNSTTKQLTVRNWNQGGIDLGGASLAEGANTYAVNVGAHAEGLQTVAYGQYSHTEGFGTKAGYAAHAEGRETIADGEQSHAEGFSTHATGNNSHAEGKETKATNYSSHAEGYGTVAGDKTTPVAINDSPADGCYSHAEGNGTRASGHSSHSEGKGSTSSGNMSHAEGLSTESNGNASHAEGNKTKTFGSSSHSEGITTTAGGIGSHAEGTNTITGKYDSTSEKWIDGNSAHAEGYGTTASANYSHAEGEGTTASGIGSHAEGKNTSASGRQSHAQGENSVASGNISFASGRNTSAISSMSSAFGDGTIANNVSSTAFGSYNISIEKTDKNTTADATFFSIGIGRKNTDNDAATNPDKYRKNAFEIKQNGDIYIKGVEGRIQDRLNIDLLVPIKYTNIKSLRDNSQLIPGQQYRITDYVTTTIQENTQSAGHLFDVIVLALSESELSEHALAIQSIRDIDGYFINSNLAVWELKYCLDNDKSRFAWADATNGKGVIYYMKDEWNNECPYDFKNIQFARWELSKPIGYRNNYDFENEKDNWIPESTPINSLKTGFYGLNGLDKTFSYGYDISYEYEKYRVEYTISESPTYCYTFGRGTDYSINGSNYGNVIKEYKNSKKTQLNNIVFLGNNCCYNSFGNSCTENCFGNNCTKNCFGNSCSYNSFGNECYDISFGNSCTKNCFGNNCYSNSFGKYCYENSFGNNCYSNSFGNYCSYNSFGNSCSYNSLSNICFSNSFGNSCSYNSLGEFCYSNSFGNNCCSNSFGNNCYYNNFGESETNLKSYYKHIIFDNGNSHINLNCTNTTSSSKYYQNVRIGLGVNNTYTYKTINDSNVGQTYETCYKPANSQTITI